MQKSSVMAKKRLGAYYTPMNVVQFLLHSSLQQQINSIAQKVKEAVKKKDHLSTSNAISHLSEIKVLDPSCGDGIFLVEALKLIEEGYEKIKLICQEGDLRLHDLDEQAYQILLTAITPRIALDNLYGVDIDATAVKNTIERLQSYLVSGKPANCYHGIRNPLENFKCALGLNIKVGNALKVPPLNWNAESKEAKEWTEDLSLYREKIRKKINLDIQQGDSCFNEAFLKNRIAKLCSSVLNKSRLVLEQMLLERPETCLRDLDDLFIWELNFPEVFIRKNQGFDIICGNPPYINLETIRNSPLNHFLRTSSRWRDLYRGKGDIQYHFLMLAIQLLREKGHLAMITSRYWPENKNADILRKQLINQARVLRLLDLGASVLFDAGIHNLLLILQKSCSESHYAFKFARLEELNLPILEFLIRENKINWEKLLAQEVFSRDGGAWRLLSGEVSSLVARIESILKEGEHHGFRLDELTHIGEGIKTGNDTVFASFEYVGAGYYRNRFDEEVQMYKFEKGLMRPVITSSKEIIPFHIAPSESYLLCTHKIGKRINQYPNAK
ncbi:MAG: Eco57I restriction-modification methylase domain-containing protein, partial [Candidatus Hodarchaeota archaeon]